MKLNLSKRKIQVQLMLALIPRTANTVDVSWKRAYGKQSAGHQMQFESTLVGIRLPEQQWGREPKTRNPERDQEVAQNFACGWDRRTAICCCCLAARPVVVKSQKWVIYSRHRHKSCVDKGHLRNSSWTFDPRHNNGPGGELRGRRCHF